MKKISLRIISVLLVVIMVAMLPACAKSNSEDATKSTKKTTTAKETEDVMKDAKDLKVTLDESKTYQTIESFGASGAWWSQAVGGMTRVQKKSGLPTREYIAQLLFDKEKGIGLTNYRYNIGAGSADSKEVYGEIGDYWRRAYSFETAPGVYDWTRDENAVWFLKKAVELGVEEVVLFANSPLTRLTKSGLAHADKNASSKSNLAPENYLAHAKYLLDVTEHFVSEGIPVKFLSPINEPQWDWTSGQEGCHYEPNEVVDVLKVFVEEISKRETLKHVEISGPEGGDWYNSNSRYMKAILEDETLANYFTTIDNHSYWSDKTAKQNFVSYLKRENLFDKYKLRASEWCEMKNGKDYGMDSALELAQVMNDDLTVLNVTSWQYWIAVSCYDYRDGLIYITKTGEVINVPKRLWAMGNFSKFVRPGYVRTESTATNTRVSISSYMGTNDAGNEETVVVITNHNNYSLKFDASAIAGENTNFKIYVTDENNDLAEITADRYVDGKIGLSSNSVTTIVIEK